MMAVHITEFGGPDVPQVIELPNPTSDPGRVAIDITHAAVGLIDVDIRQELYWDRPGLPQPIHVPDLEDASRVWAFGNRVAGLSVGQMAVAGHVGRVVSTECRGVGDRWPGDNYSHSRCRLARAARQHLTTTDGYLAALAEEEAR